LREAEQRILLITGTDSEGKPVLGPFLHSPTEPGPADLKRPSSRNQGPNSTTSY
jgi:hypothetical protein